LIKCNWSWEQDGIGIGKGNGAGSGAGQARSLAVGAFDKRCLPPWEAILGVLATTRSGLIIFNQPAKRTTSNGCASKVTRTGTRTEPISLDCV